VKIRSRRPLRYRLELAREDARRWGLAVARNVTTPEALHTHRLAVDAEDAARAVALLLGWWARHAARNARRYLALLRAAAKGA
jgi:hypothetical protein